MAIQKEMQGAKGGKRRILLVAGARPNFMKIAPLQKTIAAHTASLEQILVHTDSITTHLCRTSSFRILK